MTRFFATIIAALVFMAVLFDGRRADASFPTCTAPECWSNYGYGTAAAIAETYTTSPAFQGISTSGSGGNGVEGIAQGTSTSGVYGHASATSAFGVAGRIDTPGSGYAVYGDNDSTATNAWAGNFHGRVLVTSQFWVGSSCYTNCASDARLKKEITPFTNALSTLEKLRPVTFRYIDEAAYGAGVQTGFIAQEVEKVNPAWVGTGVDGFKTLNMGNMNPYFVEAIKELKAQNDELRQRVSDLERQRSSAATAHAGISSLWALVLLPFFVGAWILRRQRAV